MLSKLNSILRKSPWYKVDGPAIRITYYHRTKEYEHFQYETANSRGGILNFLTTSK